MRLKKSQGFTLIELLIVVAIITILAAIAVPNFLEAQTRAKVTKVKSDMRTVVTALEAYCIDNNSYINPYWPKAPRGRHTFGAWFLIRETRNGNRDGVGRQLTTPVEYISSSGIPLDPFWSYYIKEFGDVWGGGGIAAASFWYAADLVQVLNFGRGGVWYVDIEYWLQSAGPNLIIFAHDTNDIYDPSNGTVSAGDIYYVSGKGPGFL